MFNLEGGFCLKSLWESKHHKVLVFSMYACTLSLSFLQLSPIPHIYFSNSWNFLSVTPFVFIMTENAEIKINGIYF